ncbi:MAG: hypothetical protein AABZ55_01035, partial [Bdellovibrionota bacterium]
MNKFTRLTIMSFSSLSLSLLGAALVLTGCGGSPSGGIGPDFLASNTRCPRTGFINLDKSCCNAGGTQISFNGICSPATATTPAVAGALTGAATAGQIASNSNNAAKKMESGAGAATAGGLQGAATAVNGLNTVSSDRGGNTADAKTALATNKNKASKTAGTAPGIGSGDSNNGGLPAFGTGGTLPYTGAAQAAD